MKLIPSIYIFKNNVVRICVPKSKDHSLKYFKSISIQGIWGNYICMYRAALSSDIFDRNNRFYSYCHFNFSNSVLPDLSLTDNTDFEVRHVKPNVKPNFELGFLSLLIIGYFHNQIS